MQQVVFRNELHRGQSVLSIYMPNAEPFNTIVRKLGCSYSVTKKAWWLPYDAKLVNTAFKAFKAFKEVAWVDYSALKKEKGESGNSAISELANKSLDHPRQPSTVNRQHAWSQAQKEAMWAYADKLRIRKYSQSTFSIYGTYFKKFLAAHPNTDPKDITEEQIKQHIIKEVKEHNYANKTQNQMVNAIKFYYEQVLGLSKHKYWIPRPRKEFKLPVVASEEEVIRLIVAANNLKHQCIIAMLYSTGLRRGELVNLRLEDVNFDRKQVFVRGGKGKKDRTTLLSDRMVVALRKYLDMYKPNIWVFEGPESKQYSGVSIGVVVREAAKKAGIATKITPHVLRHSFATHLMDKGTDTRYIQELLGHANLNTTAIYAHVSTRDLQNITSPLDRIFNDKELKNKRLT